MLVFANISSELVAFVGPLAAFIAVPLSVVATLLYLKPLSHGKTSGKRLTWRIRDIPVSLTKDDLHSQLEYTIQSLLKDSSRHIVDIPSLTLASSSSQCATVICDEAAAHALKDEWIIDKSFIGITPLYDPGNAEVDIIAVSSISSHPLGSFKSKTGNSVWLRDFLPYDIENTRVLIYGYDTELTRGTWDHSIVDLAKFFLECVKTFRYDTKTTKRPIIFIGHGLGGLLIKEALSLATRNRRSLDDVSFLRSCYGMLFFGVPNLGLRAEQLRSMVAGRPNSQLINDLLVKTNSEPTPFLKQLNQKFFEACEVQKPNFEIVSYYERRESPTLELQQDGTWKRTGLPDFMVTQRSACYIGRGDNFHHEIPLDTDHSGLVKFDSNADDTYKTVRTKIQEFVYTAPGVVDRRFSLVEALSFEERAQWNGLNEPPYSAFRDLENLIKPERNTLLWLLERDGDIPNNGPGAQLSLSSYDFIQWRDYMRSKAMLVIGAPGQGKSVLANFVISHLENRQKDTKALHDYRIIYYFCNTHIPETQRTAEYILRSLIVQLCEDRSNFLQLPQTFRENPVAFHSAPFDTLWYHFRNLLSQELTRSTYCVIDGLDVYKTSLKQLMDNLAGLFYPFSDRTGPHLKLLCTSRPTQDLLPISEKLHCRILRPRHKDIEYFIKSEVAAMSSDVDEDIKDIIIENLLEHAGQTFLWVAIILRKISSLAMTRTVLRKNDVLNKIKDSDESLNDLYHTTILEAIDKDPVNAAIIVWTAFAKNPLSVEALSQAISVQQEGPCALTADRIIRKLGVLLDVVDNKVYLIHQSLRDFLESSMPEELQDCIGNNPQHYLAKICTSYLAFEDIDQASSRDEYGYDDDFLTYAATYWHDHINSVDDAQMLLPALEQILQLKNGKAETWIFLRLPHSHSNCIRRLRDIALAFDIGWLAELILGQISSKLSDEFTHNCLVAAAATGGNVLKILVTDDRAKCLQVTQEVVKAAAGNHENGETMMRLLLDRRGKEVQVTEEVVKAAVANHVHGIPLMKLFLDRRANEVQVTEEVVKVTAANHICGEALMRLLVHQHEENPQVTEEVAKTTAKNYLCGKTW